MITMLPIAHTAFRVSGRSKSATAPAAPFNRKAASSSSRRRRAAK